MALRLYIQRTIEECSECTAFGLFGGGYLWKIALGTTTDELGFKYILQNWLAFLEWWLYVV